MSFHIEAARLTDINSLLGLESAVFVPADGMLSRRAFRHHVLSKNMLLVARNDQADAGIAGYILVLIHKHSARIYSLAVDPACQGHGIAKLLLRHAFNKLGLANKFWVTLELRNSNERARRLYETFGFAQQGVIREYYGDGEDAVYMTLAIGKGERRIPVRKPSKRDIVRQTDVTVL